MKLFLDDIRDPPDDTWIVLRPAEMSMFYFLSKHAKVISFDHDLGLGPDGKEYPNGAHVLAQLEKLTHEYKRHWFVHNDVELLIHSANPVGRRNMEAAIASIKKMMEGRRI